uniref:Claudin n=1 Tax=Acanthochromis polyacanthus TaxID=80966 RepID=A0A3Q1FMD3_9TELE
MVSAGLEILGLSLCVIGSLLVMVACGLPMWKVTAFIEANIVVAQTIWDGLWMTCVVQSTGQMQCKNQMSQQQTTLKMIPYRSHFGKTSLEGHSLIDL